MQYCSLHDVYYSDRDKCCSGCKEMALPAPPCKGKVLGEEVEPHISEAGYYMASAQFEHYDVGIDIELRVYGYGPTPRDAILQAQRREEELLCLINNEFLHKIDCAQVETLKLKSEGGQDSNEEKAGEKETTPNQKDGSH